MGIGERMKEARKSKHISRRKMAQIVGMSESTLKGWEHNLFPLSFLQLWHFLKAAGMTFEELMEGNKENDMGVTEWIEFGQNKDGTHSIMCSRCGGKVKSKGHARSVYTRQHFKYCPVCGERMQVYTNTTEYIVGVQSKGE